MTRIFYLTDNSVSDNSVSDNRAEMFVRGYRNDGWPLCPCCGEDEVWSPCLWTVLTWSSLVLNVFRRNPLLACLGCGWSQDVTECQQQAIMS